MNPGEQATRVAMQYLGTCDHDWIEAFLTKGFDSDDRKAISELIEDEGFNITVARVERKMRWII